MSITGHKTAAMFRRYNISDGRDKLEALEKVERYFEAQRTERNVVPMADAGVKNPHSSRTERDRQKGKSGSPMCTQNAFSHVLGRGRSGQGLRVQFSLDQFTTRPIGNKTVCEPVGARSPVWPIYCIGSPECGPRRLVEPSRPLVPSPM